MKPFDFANDLTVRTRFLPHWRQAGCLYHVVVRLADSLPREKQRQLAFERRYWHRWHKEPYSPAEAREYNRLFSERVDRWLDDGHGQCWLNQPVCAATVAGAIAHFRGRRYHLDDWVIMPNHAHVLVAPLQGWELGRILHSWTSYTANRINTLVGRTGQLWQHEPYDHIVRSEEELVRTREYLRSNPSAIGLKHYVASWHPTWEG